MSCDNIRKLLENGEDRAPRVQEHLRDCAACASLARDGRLLRAGFVSLRLDEPSEPSWGFTARLMRRIGEERSGVEPVVEKIGRRVVLATLLVALTLLLTILLPSSGPLRGPGNNGLLLVQSEIATINQEPMIGIDSVDSPDSDLVDVSRGRPQGRK